MSELDDATVEAPVTRQEFALLCEVVDIIIGVPGGVADQAHHLAGSGYDLLNAWAAYRRGDHIFGGPHDRAG